MIVDLNSFTSAVMIWEQIGTARQFNWQPMIRSMRRVIKRDLEYITTTSFYDCFSPTMFVCVFILNGNSNNFLSNADRPLFF